MAVRQKAKKSVLAYNLKFDRFAFHVYCPDFLRKNLEEVSMRQLANAVSKGLLTKSTPIVGMKFSVKRSS